MYNFGRVIYAASRTVLTIVPELGMALQSGARFLGHVYYPGKRENHRKSMTKDW
jgi:hypothetical protein